MAGDTMRVLVSASGAKAKLAKLSAALLAVPVAAVETGHFAEKRLQDLTPESPAGSPHTAELWESHAEKAPNGSVRVVVSNPASEPGWRHPRTGEVVNEDDFSLIAGLEFGTRPHGPKNGKVMVFMGRDGHLVSIKWHPGTRPHHMIRQTRKEASAMFKARVKELLAAGFR